MKNLKNIWLVKQSARQANAITLVALIITIIVLLILAMVSISLVMNGGIIGRTDNSVKRYSDEEIQEKIKTAYAEYQMSQYHNPITIEQALANSGLTGAQKSGDGPWVITVEDKSYNLALDGKVEISIKANLPSFTYEKDGDHIYNLNFEEGMTWEEFVNSEYNTIGIIIVDRGWDGSKYIENAVFHSGFCLSEFVDSAPIQTKDMEIKPDGYYVQNIY